MWSVAVKQNLKELGRSPHHMTSLFREGISIWFNPVSYTRYSINLNIIRFVSISVDQPMSTYFRVPRLLRWTYFWWKNHHQRCRSQIPNTGAHPPQLSEYLAWQRQHAHSVLRSATWRILLWQEQTLIRCNLVLLSSKTKL